jgi:ATP phosphoribosyltransferase regulatory subunit
MNDKVLAAGSRDEFGEKLQQKQKISQMITTILNDTDFTPINTPLIERESTFDKYQNKNVFRLFDQVGENLVLRPDLTLPIARFLSANRQQNSMSRLYYIGDVFRRTDSLSGDYNQETQAGIELIGDQSFEAEIQALDTMLKFAQEFGIVDVQVVLSDARFIDVVLENLQLDQDLRQRMKQAIEQKNVSVFEELRATIPDFPEGLAGWLAFSIW